MRKIALIILIALTSLFSFSMAGSADELINENNNNTELNFFTGMFDFSDKGKRSGIFGLQHQNESLFRDSFIGTLSPVSGVMLTVDNSSYFYTGVQAQYKIGKINFVPSFTPGIYSEGDGKDLGHPIEFKSELQMSFDIFENSELGFSYNHLSNASLGEKNPGANSYMFNFLKSF